MFPVEHIVTHDHKSTQAIEGLVIAKIGVQVKFYTLFVLAIFFLGCLPKKNLYDTLSSDAKPADSGGGGSGNPLQGKKLWFNPNANSVKRGVANFQQPTAIWVLGDIGSVKAAVQAAGSELVTLVAYNIPQRDCGNHSAGGSGDAGSYRSWIESLAGAIDKGNAIVILEPDALALNCTPNLSELMSFAITRLKKNPNTFVYIDAGHATFPDLGAIVDRLNQANIKEADGFALNVANFYTDNELIERAKKINEGLEPKIGKKAHFVIDSSRNGNGSNGEWCNPTGRALGRKPTTTTEEPLLDAYLWIKTPGESDGTCQGGPPAGQWFDRLANELASKPPKDGPSGTQNKTEAKKPESKSDSEPSSGGSPCSSPKSESDSNTESNSSSDDSKNDDNSDEDKE